MGSARGRNESNLATLQRHANHGRHGFRIPPYRTCAQGDEYQFEYVASLAKDDVLQGQPNRVDAQLEARSPHSAGQLHPDNNKPLWRTITFRDYF